MTDDLVKRLREAVDDPFFGKVVEPIKWEAASRIEQLETALRDIIGERGFCGHCGKLAVGKRGGMVLCDEAVLGFIGPCKWTPQHFKDIARTALGESNP